MAIGIRYPIENPQGRLKASCMDKRDRLGTGYGPRVMELLQAKVPKLRAFPFGSQKLIFKKRMYMFQNIS